MDVLVLCKDEQERERCVQELRDRFWQGFVTGSAIQALSWVNQQRGKDFICFVVTTGIQDLEHFEVLIKQVFVPMEKRPILVSKGRPLLPERKSGT